jgi:Transposase
VQEPAEQVIKEIHRATRRQFSAEEKIRIVLSGLRGEDSIAELCRREGIVQNLYYRWSKEFLEAGKKRLAGDTAPTCSPASPTIPPPGFSSCCLGIGSKTRTKPPPLDYRPAAVLCGCLRESCRATKHAAGSESDRAGDFAWRHYHYFGFRPGSPPGVPGGGIIGIVP